MKVLTLTVPGLTDLVGQVIGSPLGALVAVNDYKVQWRGLESDRFEYAVIDEG